MRRARLKRTFTLPLALIALVILAPVAYTVAVDDDFRDDVVSVVPVIGEPGLVVQNRTRAAMPVLVNIQSPHEGSACYFDWFLLPGGGSQTFGPREQLPLREIVGGGDARANCSSVSGQSTTSEVVINHPNGTVAQVYSNGRRRQRTDRSTLVGWGLAGLLALTLSIALWRLRVPDETSATAS